jgi:integrase
MEFVEPIRDAQKIQDMKDVLRGNPDHGLRDLTLFVVGINAGLRISDLLNLTVGDVAEEGKTKIKVKDRIVLREQKTGKTKNFPIGKSSAKVLTDYLSSRPNCKPDAPLFPSRKGGGPIGRIQAYKILNAAARKVGIPGQIGTHTLRKTWGYHAYRAGYDLALIQQILNHSSQAITLRYIGITQDQVDEVFLTMNL